MSRVEKGRVTLKIEKYEFGEESADLPVYEGREYVPAEVADRLLEVCEELWRYVRTGEQRVGADRIEAVIEAAKRG